MSGKPKLISFCVAALGIALAFAATTGADARGRGNRNENARPGRFDYYVISLSWSPSYCAIHPGEAEQCGKGYGFVLHGLWPQYRNGSWPQHCSTSREPEEATITQMLPIMPSRHLIEHEWETHGACSGLDPKGYFALAEDAFSRQTIPPALKTPATSPDLSADDIVKAFIDVNPGLDDNMISVECKNGGTLEEVRICLDKDNLSVKSCGGRVRNSCRAGKLTIPAVR
ncbi:MAG: ribonuclease T2 [Proteobacteria bacterium]|nr:ribonuclease T2 [Pseudomonadota bacterium]